jgi:hypothetical protein
MRHSLLVRFAAFVLLTFLWTVFAVAARAEDAVAPAPAAASPSAPGDTQQPAPAPETAAAQPDAAAAPATINDCIDENGDFITTGKRYGFVATLVNKCEKRLRCVVDAYITGAKGPASGHGTLILAPKSQGDAAKKSFTIRVKTPGGTAQMSADCKAL